MLVLARTQWQYVRPGRCSRDVWGTLGVDEGVCDSAVLLTSETVANALIHGRIGARLQVHPTRT